MKNNNIVIYMAMAIIISLIGRYTIPHIHKALKEPEVVKCTQLLRPDGKSDEKEYCLGDDLIAPAECYFKGYDNKGCETLRFLESLNRNNGFLNDTDIPIRPHKCKQIDNISSKKVTYCLDNTYKVPLECYFDEENSEKCKTLFALFSENIEKGFIHTKDNE